MNPSEILTRVISRYSPENDLDSLLKDVSDLAGCVVFTTSFGMEYQAITYAIFSSDLPNEIITLDTWRMFPETYAVWSRTIAQ